MQANRAIVISAPARLHGSRASSLSLLHGDVAEKPQYSGINDGWVLDVHPVARAGYLDCTTVRQQHRQQSDQSPEHRGAVGTRDDQRRRYFARVQREEW